MKKSSEDKLRQMYDMKIDILTATCEELRKQLNVEINTNVSLRAEVAQLTRDLNNMMGRAA